jgi:hypothetical protein
MFDRYNEIRQGMDVCDLNGNKIGSVKNVYSTPSAGTASAGYASAGAGTARQNNPMGTGNTGCFEVDTGILGLGTNYYIPFSAVTGIDSNCVRVDAQKNDLNQTGWQNKPSWLENR